MHLTDFRFPALFGRLGKLIPAPLASAPLLIMLDIARRREWLLAPETLYGKCFQIQIEDMGLTIQFVCDQGKFKPRRSNAVDVDVRLSAMAADFFQLASGMADADTLFFQRKLKIEGDTEPEKMAKKIYKKG